MKIAILPALLLISGSALLAQKPHAPAKPATKAVVRTAAPAAEFVIKDTFAWNVQTTVKRLKANILDETRPVNAIVGTYYDRLFDKPYYTTFIKMPGAISSEVIRQKLNRPEGTAEWVWQTTFYRSNDGEDAQKKQIEGIINAMPAMKGGNEKNKVIDVSASVSSISYVILSVRFIKPWLQTEQQAADSLIRIYHPGLRSVETAKDAAVKLNKAFEEEGISRENAIAPLADEMRVVADRDIKAAFVAMMELNIVRAPDLTTKLSDDQKADIRKYANGFLDAYKNGTNFDVKTFDPHPPPPVYQSAFNNTGAGVFAPAPTAEMVTSRCAVCSGTGQYEKVVYSHTYNGVAADITTQRTRWVTCEFCGGTGWVTKEKGKKH